MTGNEGSSARRTGSRGWRSEFVICFLFDYSTLAKPNPRDFAYFYVVMLLQHDNMSVGHWRSRGVTIIAKGEHLDDYG